MYLFTATPQVPPSQGLLFWRLLNAHGGSCEYRFLHTASASFGARVSVSIPPADASSVAAGKENKLLWYPEDNHSLDGPVTDADYWANTGVWFLQHLQRFELPPL